MKNGGKITEQQRHAEDEVVSACVCKARNDFCVENTVGERGNGEYEAGKGAGSADIEKGSRRSNRRTNEDERAESADERGERNEKGISGADVMIATGEEVAELVGQKNSQQGECEREAGGETGGMLVEELKGAKKFVERSGLIVSEGDGELRARSEAGAERKEEEDAGDDEHFPRQAGTRGVIEIGGGNGAPIDVDRNGAARVFWRRWVHEMSEGPGEFCSNAQRSEASPPSCRCPRCLAALCLV